MYVVSKRDLASFLETVSTAQYGETIVCFVCLFARSPRSCEYTVEPLRDVPFELFKRRPPKPSHFRFVIAAAQPHKWSPGDVGWNPTSFCKHLWSASNSLRVIFFVVLHTFTFYYSINFLLFRKRWKFHFTDRFFCGSRCRITEDTVSGFVDLLRQTLKRGGVVLNIKWLN